MKFKFLILFITFVFFVPIVYANVLDEVPPYIEIIGIKQEDYKISKTITNEEIIVELEEKTTGLNYSWSFDKTKFENNVTKITLDFSIDFKSKNKQEIDNIVGDRNKVYLYFAHHGSLPGVATIKVDVSKNFSEGSNLTLYYYNEDTKEIEFINDKIKVVDGYAEFEIEHCSEYVLVQESNEETIGKMRILSYIITALGLLILALMTYTLFRK